MPAVTSETGIEFADAFKMAHAMLHHDLTKLDVCAHGGAAAPLRELYSRLRETRLHLVEHFAFEEKNGYMDFVLKREPRLERAARELELEHGQLLAGLDALLATPAESDAKRLRDRCRAWLNSVRAHECRETDLLQEAFGVEIGTDD